MASRRPRPGDRALILPGLESKDGLQYEGTICDVHDACWAITEAIKDLAKSMGVNVKASVNLNLPFWHVTLYDHSFAHIHEDHLEPIDPDADSRETESSTHKPEKV